MANIIARGINATTGQANTVTNSDTLVDSNGNPIGSGGSTITRNVETLSANKTLTNSSEQIQTLNPNGTTRKVNLPAAGSSNPTFTIHNNGNKNAWLMVMDGSDLCKASIPNGETVIFTSDGIQWFANGDESSEPASSKLGGFILSYGGYATSVNHWLTANNSAKTTTSYTSENYATSHITPVAGTIKAIGLSTTGVGTGYIRLNGIQQSGFSYSNTYQVIDYNLSVSAGDRIAVQGVTGYISCQVYVQADCGFGTIWGANLNTAGVYLRPNGIANKSSISFVSILSEACATGPAYAQHFSFYSGSSTSLHNMKLWKNGAESETFQISGTVGYTTLSGNTLYEKSDKIRIEQDATPAQGTTTAMLYYSLRGLTYFYGGNSAGVGAGEYFYVNGDEDDDSTSTWDSNVQNVMVRDGVIRELLCRFTAGGAGFNIVVNNQVVSAFGTTSSSNVSEAVQVYVPVKRGDAVGIKSQDATGAGGTIIMRVI